MYRTLTFRSIFPNEWRFDSQGNPVSPGARELADHIVAQLRKRLRNVTDVSQHSFYGWGFRGEFDRTLFYHVLNPGDEMYLTVNYGHYGLDWLLMKRPGRRFN